MRRPAALLGLLLLAWPGAASAQPDRLTPRAAPTAVLPKATPVHTEPKGRAPSALAPLLPLPTVAPPLSPVFVPGEPPAPAPPAPIAAAEAPKPVPPPEKPPEKPAERKPAERKPAERKPVEKKPAVRTVYAKEGIYIRATPGRNGRVLDTLEEGETAELLPDKAAEDGWARIARNGKPAGWVSSRFLAERSSKPASGGGEADGDCALPPDLPAKGTATIAEGAAARVLAAANVRQSPGCNTKVLDVLEEGETVTVTAVSGAWYRVARRGRTLGYVGASLLGAAGR